MIKISEDIVEVLERGIKRFNGDKLAFFYKCVTADGYIRDYKTNAPVDTGLTKQELLSALVEGYEPIEDEEPKLYGVGFKGRYVGGNGVVVASNKAKALVLINHQMDVHGFDHVDEDDLYRISLTKEVAHVLFDGEY